MKSGPFQLCSAIPRQQRAAVWLVKANTPASCRQNPGRKNSRNLLRSVTPVLFQLATFLLCICLMNMKTRLRAFCLLALWAIATSISAQQDGTTVSQYLNAWLFKDYATMYALSGTEVKNQVQEPAFSAAVSAIPAPESMPRIVQGDPAKPGSTVYLEYSTAGGSTARSSLQVGADGIRHSEVLAKATSAVPSGTSVAAGDKVVAGETANSILQKMEKATEAAETLRADVMLKGSLMGTNVNETGKLLYRAPDHMRLDFDSFLLNSNGRQSILYLSSANTYMDIGSVGGLELSPGLGTPTSELREKYDITLRSKTELEGHPVFELQMKPPTSGGIGTLMGGIGGSGNMRMWVSAQTWWPVRVKLDNITADYRNVQVNAPGITDADFQFTPPPNATPLSLGGILGGMGGGLPGE